MMLDRAAFIDQSQSFSISLKDANVESLMKHHFFTWSNGAKTGMFFFDSFY
jgi:ribonucleotide reductase alpha subunit